MTSEYNFALWYRITPDSTPRFTELHLIMEEVVMTVDMEVDMPVVVVMEVTVTPPAAMAAMDMADIK